MRWIIPQQNEIFWKNILKHDLTESEWKVIIAFVVDAPGFPVAQKVLVNRTRIDQPNVSTILKSLLQIGILIKDAKENYEINPALIDLGNAYEPQEVSTLEFWKGVKAPKNPGSGNFKKQAETKKEKLAIAENNIRKMHKEAAAKKKQLDEWQSFYSDVRQHNIFAKVEQRESGKIIIFSSGNPKTDRTAIAPMDIAEEYCRKVLKMDNPDEIICYIYGSQEQNDFRTKYNLKRPS